MRVLALSALCLGSPAAALDCDTLTGFRNGAGGSVLPETSGQCAAGVCTWAFDYRDPAAQALFDRLLTQIAACLGPEHRFRQDSGVNHPDFYDLRLISDGAGTLAVSIKDKAGLQQTFVFLRSLVSDLDQ